MHNVALYYYQSRIESILLDIVCFYLLIETENYRPNPLSSLLLASSRQESLGDLISRKLDLEQF